MKRIDTLVEDIYRLFDEGHDCSEENLDKFATNLRAIMKDRLSAYKTPRQGGTLRMSSIGKPDRQIYYDIHAGRFPTGEVLEPHTKIKFLYGDIIEEMVLLLAKEAGHIVEHEQKEVILNGVVGHIDARIDGVTTDVKSTSKYAFTKFENNTLAADDPFGYMAQISGYGVAEKTDGAFLAVNKELGKLTLLKVSNKEMQMVNPSGRIDHLREVLSKPNPPPKCYEAKPMGKSGNMQLDIGCAYCSRKQHCWSDANGGRGLRTFAYSTGPVFLTEVSNEPKVPEITKR